ncbi:MAG: signal recognition particle protein [Chloroflexi bacterium]|nr:signal recognition particle protein [Chloroflexota bacterium]
MFDALTEKLTAVFRKLSSRGRLTDKDVDEALREVRLALLEADVNFKVVRDFVAKVRERCVGTQALEGLNPAQHVVKAVHEELVAVLSGGDRRLDTASQPPTVVMLVGLQGSGKTTTAAKLGLLLRHQGGRPLLVAADTRRPAAVEQLVALGKQLDLPVYEEGVRSQPVAIARDAMTKAKEMAATWVILDTGGRLHIDEELMQEVADIRQQVRPHEVLLVVDAMTGQDAVRAADEFHKKVGLTGLILTKLDGDARGGAALSITAVTGVPVKFIGVGEKVDALEPFHPDRLASRILGMGDMLTLIEKAQDAIDQKKAAELEKKIARATFDLGDFLDQMRQVRKMGPLSQVLGMIPGFSALSKRLPMDELGDKQLKKVEAVILSMTPVERRNPDIIDGSRRRRIAKGSGTTVQDVNQLLNQFRQVQKLMRDMASGRGPRGLPFMRI